MKRLLLYITILFASCTPVSKLPDAQLQVSLISYQFTAPYRVSLTAVTRQQDTLYLLYGWRGMGKPHFYPNMKLSVQYNSDQYQYINNKKFYPARIRINH